jgi:hypothetical protein
MSAVTATLDLSATQIPSDPETSPAARSTGLTIELNDRWRVVDDPLQWMLQRRTSNGGEKHSGWHNRSYCRARDGLLRCIREYCGDVNSIGLMQVEALPEWHP